MSADAGGRGAALAEAVALGVAYAGALCALGALAVGSFTPGTLARPYWSGVPGLRTDTTGIIAVPVSAVALVVAEYLRHRRMDAPPAGRWRTGPGIWLAAAVADTATAASTVMVVYLSVNAVTHPATLLIHATHVLSWPTEGTLRVVGLGGAGAGLALHRITAIRRTGGPGPAGAAGAGGTTVPARVVASPDRAPI